MKKFLDNILLHNYIDILCGAATLIGLYVFGKPGMVFMTLLVLHIIVKKEGDERERILIAKAYAFAFNLLLGSMGIFVLCCPDVITPLFIVAYGILLRGLVGVIVFAIY